MDDDFVTDGLGGDLHYGIAGVGFRIRGNVNLKVGVPNRVERRHHQERRSQIDPPFDVAADLDMLGVCLIRKIESVFREREIREDASFARGAREKQKG